MTTDDVFRQTATTPIVCRRVGITERTLRLYGRLGLVDSLGGRPLRWEPDTYDRLRLILMALKAGISLNKIVDDFRDVSDDSGARVTEKRKDVAWRYLEDVLALIRDLQTDAEYIQRHVLEASPFSEKAESLEDTSHLK